MTPIAENSFEFTRSLFDEGVIAVTGFKKTVKRYALILFGLCFALTFMNIVVTKTLPVGYIIAFIFIGLYILWIFPSGKRKKAYKELRERNNGDMERTVTFYRRSFTVKSASEERSVDYTEIKRTIETNRLFILCVEDGLGFIVAKDGFTKGDLGDVRSLARNEWEEPWTGA